MEAAAKAPPPRQPRRNFAAWAILVASSLATCTVCLSTGARIAEQSPIRFGLPIDTLKVSGSFVRQVLSNPRWGPRYGSWPAFLATRRTEVMAGLSCASVVRWSEMRVRALGQTLGLKCGLRRIGSKDPKTATQGITLMEDWSKLGGIA